MHLYGFSTGALALGDFERALKMLVGHDTRAVELSVLREHELSALVSRLSNLDLSRYEYVSIHAPSRFEEVSESTAADLLLSVCIDRKWPIVVHPDAIRDSGCWDQFGSLLCIENMDKRKPTGRTAIELKEWFGRFPQAGFCLDLGHARQVDPSLTIANELVEVFGERLTQIHLSELDVQCRHEPLSIGTVVALRELSDRIRPVPVILESRVDAGQIEAELRMARLALDPKSALAAA